MHIKHTSLCSLDSLFYTVQYVSARALTYTYKHVNAQTKTSKLSYTSQIVNKVVKNAYIFPVSYTHLPSFVAGSFVWVGVGGWYQDRLVDLIEDWKRCDCACQNTNLKSMLTQTALQTTMEGTLVRITNSTVSTPSPVTTYVTSSRPTFIL